MPKDKPYKNTAGVNDMTANEIRQHHKMAMGRKIPDMKKSPTTRRGGKRGS